MVNELQEVQWAYLIDPCFQIENTAGRPNTGGWINIYIAGTRTKYYAARDFTGTLHPFNIPLDSLGSNIILVSPANKYDIYILNKFGTLVMSRYNVSPQVAGTSIVSGGVVLDSSDGTITIEQTGDNIYNLSIADIIDSVTANIDESITNIEGDITEINQDITNITNVVTGLPTHADVYDSIVTGIEYVTGMIPEAQVQSDWDETDPTDPAYILNKPDLDNYVTEQELIEVVSGISGFNLEYGQFYCQTTTGGAVMGRTKGNIEVTNDGKIKLKKGQSYHVTVRGGYSKTTASADYNVLSYIEYITGQNINVNVDNSVTDTQYFEISYDIYKLSSDKDYYVFFSLPTGSSVNNLFIEIHSIGCMGTGGSGSGVPVEYDAGWGINIIDNVISVDPSILNQYVTQEELVSAVSGLAPEYTAGDNIIIDDNTISLNDVVRIDARGTSSGYALFGNITHWGDQDYGPGWDITGHTDNDKDYISFNTSDQGLQVLAWGEYESDRNTGVSAVSQIVINEGDIKYQQGEFQDTATLPVIWSCSQMHDDIELLKQQGASAVCVVDYDNTTAENLYSQIDTYWNETPRKPIYVKHVLNSYRTMYLPVVAYEADQGGWAANYKFAASWAKTADISSVDWYGGYAHKELNNPQTGTYAYTKGLDSLDGMFVPNSHYANEGQILTVNASNEPEWQTPQSSGINNIVEYVDAQTTPNFFNDCVALLEQGIEPAAMYNGNMYQLWHTEKNGNTYTGLGFICVHYLDFQYSNISYDHQHAWNTQLWADANGVYPGTDRMGYNYLAGDGLNAVTGVVNGEHAITYSIDPMEVATAVSGLLPAAPTYSAGNGIDITNDVISVDNTVAMKTDIPDVSDFVTEQEVSGMIPEQEAVEFLELTAGDYIDIASGVISVSGTEDLTLMNLTAGEGISITPDVSGNVEIACTSTGVTKTILYTGSSTDSRSGTFTLSQSGYNFDRLEMTLIDVDNYVIKQVCEMPADNLVGFNGTRGSSFNSITSGTQTWFKAMNWQLNSAGTTLTYWVDEIATSGDSITAINRDQTTNRPIMLRIYGIKE